MGGTQPAGTGGISNVFLGHSAGIQPTQSSYNTFVGYQAGYTIDTILNHNVAVGYKAGFNSKGDTNISMGYMAGELAKGEQNIIIGRNAGKSVNGMENIFIGKQSGDGSLIGQNNIFLGTVTGRSMKTGTGNLLFGPSAGTYLEGGINNTIIGSGSGKNLKNGNYNTFIGKVDLPLNTTLSSTIILADGEGNQKLYINGGGNVGINTTNPTARLEIRTNVTGSAGLKFTNLNATTGGITNNTNNKFLTLNASGDVILQNLPSSTTGVAAITAGTNVVVAANGSSATPYIISSKNIYTDDGALTSERTMDMADFNLRFTSASTTGGKIYIGETPIFPTTTGDYRLYVEGGILSKKSK